MSREDEFDLLLAEWLEEGPFAAPDRVIDTALEYAREHPRRRFLPVPFRRNVMSKIPATTIASPRFRSLKGRFSIGVAAAAVLAVALVATAGLLALRGPSPAPGPASTQTHIYWANHLSGTIGRANVDGSSVDQNFVVARAGMCGVLVEGDYLYWSNDNDNAIGRVRLDGTGASETLITDTAGACALASDGTYLYWTNWRGLAGSLGRARLDGSDVNQTFVEAAMPQSFLGVTIGEGFIFWGGDENIACVRLDGRFVQDRCASLATPPTGMVVVQGYIYWGNGQGATIGRGKMSADATSVAIDADESFMTVAGSPQGLTSDGKYLYWSAGGSIGRANLDGTGVNDSFITGASVPRAVAIGR